MKILGEKFVVNGVQFAVLETQTFTPKRVTTRYRDILKFPEGMVVAVNYRGTLIPNITLGAETGVARLTVIEVDGQTFAKPGQISRALKLNSDMYAYRLASA